MEQVTNWQSRALERMYPVVFFDALRVKIKEDAVVKSKAVYLALGVQSHGARDILGLWIEGTEGAKFWMTLFNDLKARGIDDILIAVNDGLKGMPEALEAVFPATTLQKCIVHLASDQKQCGLCELEGSQTARGGHSTDLDGHECRGRRIRA